MFVLRPILVAAVRLYDGRARTALCRVDPASGRLGERHFRATHARSFSSAAQSGYRSSRRFFIMRPMT